jgi:ABC-2 type transport system ATP-binding protein
MIECRDVHKRFGATAVLRGLDFSLRRGEILGFVGPNGAGKTTTLRILTGLVFRDSGQVTVNGLDPERDPVAVRRVLSYLPGETSLYRRMRAREFLEFACAPWPAVDAALQAELTERFELPLERTVGQYSAGMKQKLALVAALVPRAEVLMLDEPDRNLDASMRHQLRLVLRRLHKDGRTLLISSHHLAELRQLATRHVFLLDGRAVPDDRIQTLTAELTREIRVRLTPGTGIPDQLLPAGTRVLADGDDLRVLADGDRDECVRRLTTLSPLALSYQSADLDAIYQRLYLEAQP